FLFYMAGGFMYRLIYLEGHSPAREIYWLTNAIYCLVTLLAGLGISSFPDFDLRLLYRPVLPLLGAGFLFFPLLHDAWSILPFTLFQSGFALFDTYTWLLFAYLAARQRLPVKVFGWGLFLITFSIFSGELLFKIILPAFSFTAKQLDLISLISVLVLLVATLVFQDKRETFAGWEVQEEVPVPEESKMNNASANGSVMIAQKTPTLARMEILDGAEARHSVSTPEDTFSIPENVTEQFLFLHNLTTREKEVFHLLLKGRNNPYIREHLNISDNTLKTHLRKIYKKLSVGNRQELISLFTEFTNNVQSENR
ncbi:MAG: helix-turn-helix transcriptional regulator, partial [Peptococcaceae bacterium]|nr:helix-turn-helix transcriptional regulator [Peptococcaceae bacterium]